MDKHLRPGQDLTQNTKRNMSESIIQTFDDILRGYYVFKLYVRYDKGKTKTGM